MLFELTILSQTTNPSPPTIISTEIVINTTGLLKNVIRLLPLANIPIKSKPALQNAETEWKSPNHMALSHFISGRKLRNRIAAPNV